MALTQITFGLVGAQNKASHLPAMLATGTQSSEDIVPSGSSQATTIAAPNVADVLPFARVATDTDVYVAFGTAPVATSATTRFFVPAGSVEYFAVKAGDKAAVGTLEVA
jgi:hypothetical protein